MNYFVIFSRKGTVVYEEGLRPHYLNSVIESIDTRQTDVSKRIRDDHLEYAIRGNYIILSIGPAPSLTKEKIKKYENYLSTHNEYRKLVENGQERSKAGEEKHAEGNALDFSDSKDSKSKHTGQDKSQGPGTGKVHPDKKAPEGRSGGFSLKRSFKLFTKQIPIDEIKNKTEKHLVEKNVEKSVIKIITDDMVAEFEVDGAQYVTEKMFRDKLAKTLRKILQSIDHERFLDKIKEKHGPYTICLIGVNGVGKSTSLAKLACWLIHKGLRVYIAACDTYRAGAIEQLKVHIDRFKTGGYDVELHENGYNKNDASVAKTAMMKAQKGGYDVLLIDTAGRMHNKENLMQSLSRLIQQSEPDHIAFVGEAISGNEAILQIKEFNRRISEFVPGRKIDSVILTKVDTVDNKIGQIVNLSFGSLAPVLFLGTGQGNMDLVEMDPDMVSEVLSG